MQWLSITLKVCTSTCNCGSFEFAIFANVISLWVIETTYQSHTKTHSEGYDLITWNLFPVDNHAIVEQNSESDHKNIEICICRKIQSVGYLMEVSTVEPHYNESPIITNESVGLKRFIIMGFHCIMISPVYVRNL